MRREEEETRRNRPWWVKLRVKTDKRSVRKGTLLQQVEKDIEKVVLLEKHADYEAYVEEVKNEKRGHDQSPKRTALSCSLPVTTLGLYIHISSTAPGLPSPHCSRSPIGMLHVGGVDSLADHEADL